MHTHTSELQQHTQSATPEKPGNRTIDLEYICLSSYVRLCVLISVFFGVVVSVTFFVLDLLVLDTAIYWGNLTMPDTWTGVVVLFVAPFMFGLVGLLGSFFTHRMFLWALRTYAGLPLTGTWMEIKNHQVIPGRHSTD